MGTQLSEFVKSVLVVDDDMGVLEMLGETLEHIGIPNVKTYSSPVDAWDSINNGNDNYDMVFLDWKMPEMNGGALLNNIRSYEKLQTVPVIIVSAMLEPEDENLLSEFPFTDIVPKPFNKISLMAKIELLIKEAIWFKQHEPEINNAFAELETDLKTARITLLNLVKKCPKPIPMGLVASRALIKHGCFHEAKKILGALIAKEPDCYLAINELARIKLMDKDFVGAKELLDKVQALSPRNLDRLCLLGDSNLNIMNFEEAQKCYKKALSLDEFNPTAKAGKKTADNIIKYREQAGLDGVTNSFASVLNAIGVSLVRTGKIDEGIEQYSAAMRFVHDNSQRARLSYNVGLGYVRDDKPGKALPWFKKSALYSDGTFEKSMHHLKVAEVDFEELKANKEDADIQEVEIQAKPSDQPVPEDLEEFDIPMMQIETS